MFPGIEKVIVRLVDKGVDTFSEGVKSLNAPEASEKTRWSLGVIVRISVLVARTAFSKQKYINASWEKTGRPDKLNSSVYYGGCFLVEKHDTVSGLRRINDGILLAGFEREGSVRN